MTLFLIYGLRSTSLLLSIDTFHKNIRKNFCVCYKTTKIFLMGPSRSVFDQQKILIVFELEKEQSLVTFNTAFHVQ